ncbi:hypothetical protein SLA2020_116820 [Shorea laevis]
MWIQRWYQRTITIRATVVHCNLCANGKGASVARRSAVTYWDCGIYRSCTTSSGVATSCGHVGATADDDGGAKMRAYVFYG